MPIFSHIFLSKLSTLLVYRNISQCSPAILDYLLLRKQLPFNNIAALTCNLLFQSKPDPRVLVIQPQAAAHGVTLTAADTVVFWGPVTSVETYIQCIARADRIGQKGANVTVHHLQSSDIEARMFKQLESRVEDHTAIVKLYNEEMQTL